jgi:hypothetical protein
MFCPPKRTAAEIECRLCRMHTQLGQTCANRAGPKPSGLILLSRQMPCALCYSRERQCVNVGICIDTKTNLRKSRRRHSASQRCALTDLHLTYTTVERGPDRGHTCNQHTVSLATWSATCLMAASSP